VPWKKYWGELVATCASTASSLKLNRHEKICIVATVAAQHMYGLEHSVILPMQMGFAVCSSKPFFMEDIRNSLHWDAYETVLFSTPLQLKQCADADVTFPPLKMLVSSTARLATTLAVQLETKFSACLYELYGCTEAGCIAVRRTTQTEQWTLKSNYRLSYKGRDCYLDLNSNHQIKLSDDLEKISEGRFLLRGRLTENINIAGNRMSLSDLNIKLNSIAGVKDGIFHLPEPEHIAARLMAFVVTDGLTADDIKKSLRSMLNPIFVPRTVVILDKLPRNELGKIDNIAMLKLANSVERSI
jgi:acyl-coenzyme A synthetase/AMP-(fatty) acid ligase